MIPVTKPFLHLQKMYSKHLDGIWQCLCLSNMVPLTGGFEMKLKEYLHVYHILFVTNDTVALQILKQELLISEKDCMLPPFKTCKL